MILIGKMAFLLKISSLPLHGKIKNCKSGTFLSFNPSLLHTVTYLYRVAEVAREYGWHPPKSWDSDENFKPEHSLFCRKLRLVAIYALFGDLWAKKVPFWVKNSVSWVRSALLHGIYCIFY